MLRTNFRASKASGPKPVRPLSGHESPLSFSFHTCKVGHTTPPSRGSCGHARRWTDRAVNAACPHGACRGVQVQELGWAGSLAQDPGPGTIQDRAGHPSAAVSVEGAKARAVSPSMRSSPSLGSICTSGGLATSGPQSENGGPKRSRVGPWPRSHWFVWAGRPAHFLRAWRHHPISSQPFTPLLSPPAERAPTESDGAGRGAPERGAVRKGGGRRWTAAGAVLHQCWPGHHRPVTGPRSGPCVGSTLPRKRSCSPQMIPTVPAYSNTPVLCCSAPFCL